MALVPYTYEFKVDTGRNATFGASIDDITAYVMEAEWALGMRKATDSFAQPSELRLTLKNTSLDFLPDQTVGGEVLTNGTFTAWTGWNPDGWTRVGVSNPIRSITPVDPENLYGGGGTGAANFFKDNSTTDLYLTQTALTVGYTYRLRLNVTAIVEGSVLIARCNGATVMTAAAAGPHEAYFNAGATALHLSAQSVNCNITIDNASVQRVGLYSRLVRPGTLVRARMTYGGSTKTMWIGKVTADGVQFDPNPYEDPKTQVVQITARDGLLDMLDEEYQPPLLLNRRVDEVVAQVFDDLAVSYPYARSAWILDAEGASELDLTTDLAPAAPLALDAAETTLTYVGDNADRGGGVNPQTYLRDLVAAELTGRFFWSRDGAYTFHSRGRDDLNLTVSATIGDPLRVKVDHGGDLANEVMVSYVEKDLGAENTVLWQQPKLPVKVSPGSSRTFNARYTVAGQEDRRIGGTNIIHPVRGYDVIVTRDEDGDGAVIGIDIIVEVGATSTKIELTNKWTVDMWVQQAQIRGQPLISYEADITMRDANSIFANDLRPLNPIRLRLLDDGNLAEAYAGWLINRYSTAVTRIIEVELDGAMPTHAAAIHACTIGSRIRLTVSYLNHTADYFIVGERHRVDFPNGRHPITWILKPQERAQTWLLEDTTYGLLDSTAVLGL